MRETPADLVIARELDCAGLLCPLPVVETTHAIAQLDSGDCILVVCTDPAADLDLAAFCAREGHRLAHSARQGDELRFWIVKS